MKYLTGVFFITAFMFCGLLAGEEKQGPFNVAIAPSSEKQKAAGFGEHVFVFENPPVGQELIVSFCRVLQKEPHVFKDIETISFNDQGRMIIDKEKEAEGYSLEARGFAPGERVKYRFSDPNGKVVAETSYVPKPIRKKSDKGTFVLNAELILYYPTMYLMSYEGLDDSESVQVISSSETERIEHSYCFQKESSFVYMPGTEGKNGGAAFHMTKRKSGDSIKTFFSWGDRIVLQLSDEWQAIASEQKEAGSKS